MKNDDFNQQLKNIFLEKYNVENPNQLEEVKQKKVDIELKHFGMLYSRTFKFRQLARENLIRLHLKQFMNGECNYTLIGPFERECLDIL
jgi:hypothetical protein